MFFRYPLQDTIPLRFSYDESLIWSTAAHLGWPWAPDKFCPFSETFKYIGFKWSLARRTIALPSEKCQKYKAKLDEWSTASSLSLKSTESLIGTLNHACLVIPQGRSHLPALYAFRASFPTNSSRFLRHHPPKAALEEIEWWRRTLDVEWCGIVIQLPPEPMNVDLFVDASTSWGIGLVLDGRWLAWPLKTGWKSDGRDIGWAEMVAVDLAVKTLINAGYANCHVILKSDNTGVVGALTAGYSRSTQQNFILRHIVDSFQAHGIWLTIKWIASDMNLADGPSQGCFPPKRMLLPFPPSIPQYLRDYVRFAIQHREILSV